MTTRRSFATLARVTGCALWLTLLAPHAAAAAPDLALGRAALPGLSVPFIENQGQVHPRVAYYAPTFAGTVFVTHKGEVVYSLPAARAERAPSPDWSLTETLPGGAARPTARDPSGTGVSYFIGNDPARWRSHVPSFAAVSLGEVWPGVTVALRAGGRTVEKVFTVAPGASVDRIRVRVRGARGLSVDSSGALVAETGRGAVTFTAPVAYQERDGVRRAVTAAYRLVGREYAFTVGAYDRSRPLVIDPLLQSTYLGGSSFDDQLNALAIHPMTGHVYVAGATTSTDFPGVAGGAQSTKGDVNNGSAFVARLTADLTGLVQATYLGGSVSCNTRFCHAPGDVATALAIDALTGDVYVAGGTRSFTFPGTAGGAQSSHAGSDDAFLARLPSSLTSIIQATYLGGSGTDIPAALAIQPVTGDVYVAGATDSAAFPGAAGGAQPANAGGRDAFVALLPRTLTAVTRATYLGGGGNDSANALAMHPATGEVYVAGATDSADFPGTGGGAQPTGGGQLDAFVARLDAALTSIAQATYLGGGQIDLASAVAIHPATGDVYVAGQASSTNFPGTAGGARPFHGGGIEDGMIARLAASLTTLIQATYLGGAGTDVVKDLAIHPGSGDVYVAGFTQAADFPGTAGGVQSSKPKSENSVDGFVARLPRTLTAITQATYLGGTDVGDLVSVVRIDAPTGDVYVAGLAASTDFPGAAGGAQPTRSGSSDGFVARLTADLRLGADLTVAKTHAGNFVRGQVGATYTVTVRNVGTVATRGEVTVRDFLAAGLTAASIGGSGWSCALATLTCTRADLLTAGASYPPITVTVNVPANAPNSVTNTAAVSGGSDFNPANDTAADRLAVGTFTDVGPGHLFFTWIEALVRAGITGGCSTGPPQYCPDLDVTRGQMAVFLLRGIHGAGFTPPAATGTMFADVPASHPFATWIEQLAREGITGGCASGPPRYCPDAGVTRAEMAVFLLRAIHGAGFSPPPATGLFADVPVSNPFAPWIEQLAREGITTGCSTSPPLYCPDDAATRGQIAVFLDRSFRLPVPDFRPVVAYVTNSNSKSVSVVDTSNNAVATTIDVGRTVTFVVAHPDGTRVYVGTGADTILVIDTSSNLVASSVTAPGLTNALAVNPAGTRLYVASTSGLASSLLVFDTSTHTQVATVLLPASATGVAVHPAGTRVYVSTGSFHGVVVIDASTNTVITTVDLGMDVSLGNIVVHPAGSRAYVAESNSKVGVIDTATNTVLTNVSVEAAGIAVHPDGTRVYVSTFDNMVSVIETAGNTVVATFSVGAGGFGLALHPDGTRLYVAAFAARTLTVVDTATNGVVASVPVGEAPAAVAVTRIPL